MMKELVTIQTSRIATPFSAVYRHEGGGRTAALPPGVGTVDPIEISDDARTSADESAVRDELVARIRAEIAAGRYETREKVEVAVDRLIQDLDL
ncbi:MAG: hypothetical protein CHACPFDD_01606 [Phycisphaerae bacterium]|nr:hypothetical protein [Phycisphaerae bacterium]